MVFRLHSGYSQPKTKKQTNSQKKNLNQKSGETSVTDRSTQTCGLETCIKDSETEFFHSEESELDFTDTDVPGKR